MAKKIKLLKVNPNIYRQFQNEISGNENITYDMCRRKFTRNAILAQQDYNPYNEDDEGVLYRYGYLQFIVRNHTVIWMKSRSNYPRGWVKDPYLYEELNQKLGIS
jgi:hypothetical protein